jgi:2-keto-4-pentenoate hydratase/2-oxohepta-3-ene-1,7-dioic acid hydratase in catechol pathway
MRQLRFSIPDVEGPLQGTAEDDCVLYNGRRYPLSDVELLAPCTPSKIVCLGRNYPAHAKEFKNEVPDRPILFFKPPSAVIGPEREIILPPRSCVDYEAELAVVISRRCRDVSAAQAMEYICGYTCMNDVSDREAQRWEKNWVRAKGFDTAAPLGPVIVTTDEIEGPFHLQLRLNGELRQDGWTNDMVFGIPEIIEEVSSFMTLEPGDVIATGTPAGVGPLSRGDVVEVEIEGIGILRNRVRSNSRA